MKLYRCIAILICMTLYISGASAVTYRSFVDLDYGFYKVIDSGTKTTMDDGSVRTNFTAVNYTNKSLTVNAGDTVVWINYDPKDWPITIFSEEGLWGDNNSYLKQSYRTFNYTFTNPGKYGISIKENLALRQIIIVNPVTTPVQITANDTQRLDIPVQTPLVTLTQISTIPEKTPENMVPGLGATGVVMAILLTLYISKTWKGR